MSKSSNMVYKLLVVGVIVLFVCVGIQPAFAITIDTGNNPPEAPDIYGPVRGKPRVEIDFVFVSTDPDDDNVSYYIDWDDNTTDELGPYESGVQVTITHIFYEKRDYFIKAKAIDHPYGAESDWSEFWLRWHSRTRASSHLWYHWFLEQYSLLEVFLRMMNLLR